LPAPAGAVAELSEAPERAAQLRILLTPKMAVETPALRSLPRPRDGYGRRVHPTASAIIRSGTIAFQTSKQKNGGLRS